MIGARTGVVRGTETRTGFAAGLELGRLQDFCWVRGGIPFRATMTSTH